MTDRIRVERPLPAEGQQSRITEVWAWTTVDPLTDTEGIIAAKLPGGGALPLVGTVESLVRRYEWFALEACRAAADPHPSHPRLRRFVPADPD